MSASRMMVSLALLSHAARNEASSLTWMGAAAAGLAENTTAAAVIAPPMKIAAGAGIPTTRRQAPCALRIPGLRPFANVEGAYRSAARLGLNRRAQTPPRRPSLWAL